MVTKTGNLNGSGNQHDTPTLQDVLLRHCAGCDRFRPQTSFYADRTSPGGFSPLCKGCVEELARPVKSRVAAPVPAPIQPNTTPSAVSTVSCTQCGTVYPRTAEYFHRNGSDLRSYCKQCAKKYMKAWNAKRTALAKATRAVPPETKGSEESVPTVALHKCTGPCGLMLPRTAQFFYRDKDKPDGLRLNCKECVKRSQAASAANVRARVGSQHSQVCPQCGESKPATREHFYWQDKDKGLLNKRCIECLEPRLRGYSRRRKQGPAPTNSEPSVQKRPGLVRRWLHSLLYGNFDRNTA